MPGMAGKRLRSRRRDERTTAIKLLLDDPETIRAANEALALAEQTAWPFVASVGAETVAPRWVRGTSSARRTWRTRRRWWSPRPCRSHREDSRAAVVQTGRLATP
jgi:hypothetical protein